MIRTDSEPQERRRLKVCDDMKPPHPFFFLSFLHRAITHLLFAGTCFQLAKSVALASLPGPSHNSVKINSPIHRRICPITAFSAALLHESSSQHSLMLCGRCAYRRYSLLFVVSNKLMDRGRSQSGTRFKSCLTQNDVITLYTLQMTSQNLERLPRLEPSGPIAAVHLFRR